MYATESAHLLILESADYHHILEDGFDGKLKSRVAMIEGAPLLACALRHTGVRPLAFAAKRHVFPLHSILYQQGQVAKSLFLILQGECKVRAYMQS